VILFMTHSTSRIAAPRELKLLKTSFCRRFDSELIRSRFRKWLRSHGVEKS
jgi:hypothetical protein